MPGSPLNQAAWRAAPQNTLQNGSASFESPGIGEVVIQNSALGIYHIDKIDQSLCDEISDHVNYPTVLGQDVSGTIVAVGKGVNRFRVGDRVLAIGNAPPSDEATDCGFQLYTVAPERFTTLLPKHVSFQQAGVLPLAVLTASQGLFGILGISQPAVPAMPPTAAGVPIRTIIIAGGASTVGGTAIQLATSAGYEVVSTASPENFSLVKRLGATHVFDYNSTSLVDDLSAATHDKLLSGAFAIGDGSADTLARVLRRHQGPTIKRIAYTEGKHSVGEETGIKVVSIVNDTSANSPARSVFEKFLPNALAARQFVPTPEPQVVGTESNQIQPALATLKWNISAGKVAIML